MIHDYPKEKAFVYDNKIVIKDADSKNTLNSLTYNLDSYWDDSLKAKRVRQFGVFNTLIQPIAYQPERVERTIHYMQNYLASKGYHHPNLTLIAKTDTVHDEWRVHLNVQVQLNKKTIMDTVTYQLGNSDLQKIAITNSQDAYVKKGMPFSNESINNELDRLVGLFRSNGYYYFTKEKIFAEVDTINQSLMTLNLDPLAQVNQIQEAHKRESENPNWKISFQLRNIDNKITKAYPVGEQLYYSDLSLSENPDTILNNGRNYTDTFADITHLYNRAKFKTALFDEQSLIHK